MTTRETATSPDGTTIAFERVGDGPVLLLLDGAFNTRASAAGLARLLADDFTVVTVDRRGRGDSDDAGALEVEAGFRLADTSDREAAVAREVADVRAVIDAVGGTAMLYGHSSGGALALETAAALPYETRVAAYEPPYSPDGGGQNPTPAAVDAALAAGDRDTAAALFLGNVGMDVDAARSQPWWQGMVGLAPTLPYEYALTDDAPPERLVGAEGPALLLVGGDSSPWMVAAVSAAAARLPHAVTQTVPGQGHAVQDDVVAPLLRAFFLRR
ncbi:alpha/beta fold hydrolase [Leifsonia sp. F6_8S_P_1B]|uniref:Alpha/beta fold hydrolase n=1 Tax=Leifsonia williamsii TaxID=3035919 RepID=A0ABT8K9R7_9MICO|nr:alpha/beta fold hydrolase [Leifsonia williamsii]MDN4613561.1 alpha/beta fold hydrolase [Leifsonia williamsii]